MAKKHRTNEVRLFGGVRRNRRTLMMTTALQATALLVLAVPGHAQPAPNARPMGGQVVVGQASIAASATTTAITQGSQRAAIDWRSFDVGSQHTVTFAQPSSSAIALNRVIGPDPSQIAGKITANGQVALVNQSGVVFYKGSQVNASSLIVSAAGITNQNFAAGKMIFDQPARPNARIENHGNITVKETGLAALVAPQVVNSGTITAKLGHVVLAGATTHTVDLYGDGLLSIDVTGQVKQVPVGPDGKKATALVTNTGVIAADGGTITLTAQAADGIVQNLVSAGGKLRANSVGDKTGTIRVAGIGGSVTIEGAATAEGAAPGTRGGQIELAASNAVRVASGATVNASGRAGGGTVAVGTTLARARGGAAVKSARTAKSTILENGATIRADATDKGDGGRVVLLSTEKTDHAGTITARGGAQGGNGGFVETSGDKGFALTGTVDLAAPTGHVGTLLIDPTNLTVSDTQPVGSSEIAPLPPGSTVAYNDLPADAWIRLGTLNRATADITLQATNDLRVAYSNDSNNTIDLPYFSLTMQAGHDLSIDRGITINTTGLTLASGFGFPGGPANHTGSIGIGASGPSQNPVGINATNVTMQAGTTGINLTDTIFAGLPPPPPRPPPPTPPVINASVRPSLAASDQMSSIPVATLDISAAGGGVTQNTNGEIFATSLQSSKGASGAVNLVGSANAIDNIADLKVNNGSFTLVDSGSLSVAGRLSATAIDLTAGADINIPGTVNAKAINLTAGANLNIPGTVDAAAGPVRLIANDGTITETGTLITGLLSGDSGGAATSLKGATATTNQIDVLGTFTAGDFTLHDGKSLRIDGPLAGLNLDQDVSPARNVIIDVSGDLGIAGSIMANTVAIDATGAISVAGRIDTSNGNGVALTGSDIAIPGTITAVPVNYGSAPVDLIASTGDVGITGSINGGSVTVNAAGSLNVAGSVDARGTYGGGVALTGSDITIPGRVTATPLYFEVPAPIILTARSGAINESGALSADTLSGSSVGPTNLMGATPTTNQVAALGNFAAGSFAFRDGSALPVDGAVSATSGNVFLASPAATGITISRAGSVSAPADKSVSFEADKMTILPGGTITGGTFELAPDTAAGSAVTLGTAGGYLSSLTGIGPTTVRVGSVTLPGAASPTTTASTITVGGTFDMLNRALELDASGPIDGIGSPLINVARLAGGGSVVTLTNAGNTIAGLGDFTASSFQLNDSTNLAVLGSLKSSSDATIVDFGTLTVAGRVSSPQVNLNASNLTIPGTVTDGGAGTVSLTANAGTIDEMGTLIAGTLTGTSIGTTSLTGATTNTNQIGTLGNFSAAGFTLNDGQSLTVAGTLNGGPNATLLSAGTLTVSGKVSAAAVSLIGGNIAVPGTVTDGGAGLVSLTANAGTIDETGTLISGTLTGSSTGSTSLTGATTGTNEIGTLGNFSASGFTLNDGKSLTIGGTLDGGPGATLLDQGTLTVDSGGTVTAGTIGLTAGSVVADGTVSGDPVGTVTLTANSGPIQETGTLIAGALQLSSATSITRSGGTLVAQTLTGNSGTLADLGSGASIDTLGNFTVGSGDLVLANDQPLVLAGRLSAPNVRVSAVGQITLTGNIATIGAPLSAQGGATPASSGSYLFVQPDATGAASLVQSGTSTVNGLGGSTATVRLQLPPSGGRMQFDDLEVPLGNLVLGTGTGIATGTIRTGTLLIVGAGGSATLVGAVAGDSSPGAAAIARISQVDPAYTFNGCTIGITICTAKPVGSSAGNNGNNNNINGNLVTSLGAPSLPITSVLGGLAEYGFLPTGLPPLPKLSDVVVLGLPSLPAPPKQLTDPDVVPPNISVQDY